MREVKLSQLKSMCRLYADERPGGAAAFINDDELRDLINGEIANQYDLLVHAGGHERHVTVNTSLTTTAGTATVALPDDFYELVSLHINWGTRQLERVDALDSVDDRRDVANLGVWTRDGWKAYRLRKAQAAGSDQLIEFFPTPTTTTALDVRYVPTAPVLTADDDAFDGVNGWERLIEYSVAAEMQVIAGKNPGPLAAMAQRERERIEMLAHQMTASAPERVRDVRYANRSSWRRLGPVPTGST
jgi:hypothetical protein